MLKCPEHGFGFQDGFWFPGGDRLSILYGTLGGFPERHGFSGDLGFKRASCERKVGKLGRHALGVTRGHGALLALGTKGGGDQLAGLDACVFRKVIFWIGGLALVVDIRIRNYHVSVIKIQLIMKKKSI